MTAGGPGDNRGYPDDGQEDDLLTIIPERMMPEEGPYDEPRKGRSLLMAAALIGLSVAGAAGFYMLGQDSGSADGTVAAPTIPASPDPYKVRPTDPGGMQVPNQDKLVYDRIDNTAEGGAPVEKLLPEPMTPQIPAGMPSVLVQQGDSAPPPPPVLDPPRQAAVEVAPVVEAQPPAVPVEAPKVEAPRVEVPAEAPKVEAPRVEVPAEAPKVEAPKVEAPKVEVPPKPAAAPVEDKAATPNGQVAAVVAGQAPVTSGGYMIQLAALRDEASAKKSWAGLQAKYPDLLGGLSLKVEKADLGDKGVFYRVRGAGIPTEERARTICTELGKRNVGCLFVGK